MSRSETLTISIVATRDNRTLELGGTITLYGDEEEKRVNQALLLDSATAMRQGLEAAGFEADVSVTVPRRLWV
jgi:hypothetical protein